MNRPLFDDAGLVEDLIGFAQKHGEDSDPDHEVGDLQDLLRAAWKLMTPEQRRAMLTDASVSNVVESATGEALLQDIDDLLQDEWGAVCDRFGLDDSFQYTDLQKLDAVNHYRLEMAAEPAPAAPVKTPAAPRRKP